MEKLEDHLKSEELKKTASRRMVHRMNRTAGRMMRALNAKAPPPENNVTPNNKPQNSRDSVVTH